jgi:hypothetical protein
MDVMAANSLHTPIFTDTSVRRHQIQLDGASLNYVAGTMDVMAADLQIVVIFIGIDVSVRGGSNPFVLIAIPGLLQSG